MDELIVKELIQTKNDLLKANQRIYELEKTVEEKNRAIYGIYGRIKKGYEAIVNHFDLDNKSPKSKEFIYKQFECYLKKSYDEDWNEHRSTT